MTDEEINKRIHELLGLCQHDWDEWLGDYEHPARSARCTKCSREYNELLSGDFTTSWEGYGMLITWWQEQKKTWDTFCNAQEHIENCYCGKHISTKYISPRNLAEATVKFFESNKTACPDTTGWGEEDGFIKEKK